MEAFTNLIQATHDMRSKGKLREALLKVEEALNDKEITSQFNDLVTHELQTKKLEYNSELLHWSKVSAELSTATDG